MNTIQTSSRKVLTFLILAISINLGLTVYELFVNGFNEDVIQHFYLAFNVYKGKILYHELFDNHGFIYTYLNALLLNLIKAKRLYESIEILSILNFTFVFLWLFMSYKVMRTKFTKTYSMLMVCIISSHPVFISSSNDLRPDVFFNFVGTFALFLLLKIKSSAYRALATGLFFCLVLLTHPKAAPIALALFVVSLTYQFSKRNLVILVTSIFIFFATSFVLLYLNGALRDYYQQVINFNFNLFFNHHTRFNGPRNIYNLVENYFQFFFFFLVGLFAFVKNNRQRIGLYYLLVLLLNFPFLMGGLYTYILLSVLPSFSYFSALGANYLINNYQKNATVFITILALGILATYMNNFLKLKIYPELKSLQRDKANYLSSISDYKDKVVILDLNAGAGLFNSPFHQYWYLTNEHERIYQHTHILKEIETAIDLNEYRFLVYCKENMLADYILKIFESQKPKLKHLGQCLYEKH